MSTDPFAETPLWFSQFIRHDVRPFLLQHRVTALDRLARWRDTHAQQQIQLREWQARHDEHVRRLDSQPAEPWHSPERPGAGFGWCQAWRDPETGEFRRILGWMAPGLTESDRPPTDWPLPLPDDRDLSPDECWAVLLALHDDTRDPRDGFVPTVNGVRCTTQTGTFSHICAGSCEPPSTGDTEH